ncbi:MAG: hypothetical protein QM635_09640 [Microbacteriaceae bacterium]
MGAVEDRPNYPTWIKPSRIRLFWLLAAAVVIAAVVVAIFWLPGLAIAVLALPFVYIAVVITLSSWRLSPRGDDLQAKIHSDFGAVFALYLWWRDASDQAFSWIVAVARSCSQLLAVARSWFSGRKWPGYGPGSAGPPPDFVFDFFVLSE